MNLLTFRDGSEIALPAKALSLTQPYATLMMPGGYKRNETRSWRTSYRGTLVIHAAKGFPGWAKELCFSNRFICQALTAGGYRDIASIPTGCILGAVDLVDVMPVEKIRASLSSVELATGNYEDGRFAWITENPRQIEGPFPVSLGALSIWELRPENCAVVGEGEQRS